MSVCGSAIVYRGIRIEDPLTQEIHTEPVYDTFGGVDIIGIRVRMTFIASLHTAEINCHGYKFPGASPVSNCVRNLAPELASMIEKFLIPRGQLQFFLGDQIVWDVVPSFVEDCSTGVPPTSVTYDYDIENGPRTSLRILSVQGSFSVRAAITIEFVKALRCTATMLKDWVNMRYTVDEDIDTVTWIRSRTYRGKFRVAGISPLFIDPYKIARDIALPPLQRGFRRKVIRWGLSENGLEVPFTIVDEQQRSAAPAPASDWDGEFTVEFPNGEVNTESTLRFALTAAPEVPRPILMKLVQVIIDKKLRYQERNEARTGKVFVTSAMFSESLRNNTIRAEVRVKNFDTEKYLMNIRAANFTDSMNMFGVELPITTTVGTPGYPQEYDPQVAAPPPESLKDLRGTFVCALQNPCCPTQFPDVDQSDQGDTYHYDYPQSHTDSTLTPRTSTEYSRAHGDKMYQWYKLSSEYVGDTGWRGFPRGASCTSSGNNATVAFAQIHCPVGVRHIRIHAARIDEWPQLPRLENWRDRNGILHVLAHHRVEPCPVALSADAQNFLCEAYVDLYYYLDRPPDVSSGGADGILAGVLPYTTEKWVPRELSAIKPDRFIDPKLILDYGQGE